MKKVLLATAVAGILTASFGFEDVKTFADSYLKASDDYGVIIGDLKDTYGRVVGEGRCENGKYIAKLRVGNSNVKYATTYEHTVTGNKYLDYDCKIINEGEKKGYTQMKGEWRVEQVYHNGCYIKRYRYFHPDGRNTAVQERKCFTQASPLNPFNELPKFKVSKIEYNPDTEKEFMALRDKWNKENSDFDYLWLDLEEGDTPRPTASEYQQIISGATAAGTIIDSDFNIYADLDTDNFGGTIMGMPKGNPVWRKINGSDLATAIEIDKYPVQNPYRFKVSYRYVCSDANSGKGNTKMFGYGAKVVLDTKTGGEAITQLRLILNANRDFGCDASMQNAELTPAEYRILTAAGRQLLKPVYVKK